MRMAEVVGETHGSPDFASWVAPHLTAMTQLAIRLAP
jgi:hypothetical protein